MEDKVFLDESGLGEVGKVINKFYASKDDLKDLDSLKSFVDSHNEIKLHYITKEEYKKMEEDDKLPRLADITDPISIVGMEQTSEGGEMWNDDPWISLYTMGLDVESLAGDVSQKYFLFNITPNHKIISDRINNVDFQNTPLKDQNMRLQIAFGEKDQCLYWRFLYDSKGDTGWIFIQDLYSKQNVNNLQARYKMLEKQFKDKVDKVDGKGLSTNDFTDEKLQSFNKMELEQERFDIIKELSKRVGIKQTTAIMSGNYGSVDIYNFMSLEDDYSNIHTDRTNKYILDSIKNGTIKIPDNMQLTVTKDEFIDKEKGAVCFIIQKLYDPFTGVAFGTQTKIAKKEYSDEEILKKINIENIEELETIVPEDNWHPWVLCDTYNQNAMAVSAGKLAEGYACGLMTPDDKLKLDSINIDQLSKPSEIVNDLTTGGADKVLSAEQGKVLNEIKVDKVPNKQLSTNDYTNEDKKKLDSINVEAINSADNSNASTIKFCDVEKEVLIKGADAPVGLYIDNAQVNYALKIYRIFISEETQIKSYIVNVLPLDDNISTPDPMEYSWQNNKWTQKVIGPSLAEPNSVADQILQLEERIKRLESKIQK